MEKHRGKKQHRESHPKIFVWTHTEKAEFEYFKEFKNNLKTPLLMQKKEICWEPQELIEKVIKWKQEEKINEEDGDQVWCVFDVDDFYKKDPQGLLQAIKEARDNKIKIAYANECFELWILLHFEKPCSRVSRGKDVAKKIATAFKRHEIPFKKDKSGNFKKNQPVFEKIKSFQCDAIKNAKQLMPIKEYEKIKINNWNEMLSNKGNPSTSIHFLIDEINHLICKEK